jgi:hypothetical protein
MSTFIFDLTRPDGSVWVTFTVPGNGYSPTVAANVLPVTNLTTVLR